MSRTSKRIFEPCCYHVTHRCQERRFLLRFEKDRANYRSRLREAVQRYDVEVLNYVVTSNHVHLLLWAKKAPDVSCAMHFLQGNSARDFNRRKRREGAFWNGRYHATVIQGGTHLAKCLFYIDLNMVRAGVCRHPSEWEACGYRELAGKRQRYRIINLNRLRNCLACDSTDAFEQWYQLTLTDKLSSVYHAREPWWSEAAAVGDAEWLGRLIPGLESGAMEEIAMDDDMILPNGVAETGVGYAVNMNTREQKNFWKSLGN